MIVRLIAAILLLSGIARAEPRAIEGTYRNPALGYSIQIPRGLKGFAGEQGGPERGVRIALSSGGEIVAFGEYNSLDWKTPAEGVQFALASATCRHKQREISSAHIGRFIGAKGRLACDDRMQQYRLLFRPGGGPIYWLQLETTRAHESDDAAILDTVAASLRLIRWE